MTPYAARAYDVFAELARLEALASGAFCRWPRRTWRSHILTAPVLFGFPVGVALLWTVLRHVTDSSA
jgi:hypothetical protein